MMSNVNVRQIKDPGNVSRQQEEMKVSERPSMTNDPQINIIQPKDKKTLQKNKGISKRSQSSGKQNGMMYRMFCCACANPR